VLCVVRWRSLHRADHPYRGVLPSVVCLSVLVKPRQRGGPGPLLGVAQWKEIIVRNGLEIWKENATLLYRCKPHIYIANI
jgi:hypothetical protein